MNISTIIPTYKPQNYIFECLDSIKAQTFPRSEFEIVLVLNGCNEPYYSQISDYIATNLSEYNVNFIQTDEPGVSNARNIALDNSKGEYITFIDDDDMMSDTYLYELYKNVSEGCMSLSNMTAFEDVSGKVIYEYISKSFNKCKAKKNISFFDVKSYFSTPCSKLIHRSIIGDSRFQRKFSNGEDGLFMFEISKHIKTFKLTESSAIYKRRVRQTSLSQSIKSNRRYILSNGVALILSYTKVYLGNVKGYNFFFYILRILAVFKWMVIKLV